MGQVGCQEDVKTNGTPMYGMLGGQYALTIDITTRPLTID